MTGPPQAADRAAALLRLAQAAWDAGEAVEAAQALPVYQRDKVALTTAERAAQAADRSRAATLA
jgi:tRNA threonylcarbamoyladenosine biosynthesis protein TsaB